MMKKQMEDKMNKEKMAGEIAIIKAKGEEDRKTKAFEYYLETGEQVDESAVNGQNVNNQSNSEDITNLMQRIGQEQGQGQEQEQGQGQEQEGQEEAVGINAGEQGGNWQNEGK
jgi:hypothetical protein